MNGPSTPGKMSAADNRLMRASEVAAIAGVTRETIRRLEKNGDFPRRIKMSPDGKAVGWLASEVEAWLAARAAARS